MQTEILYRPLTNGDIITADCVWIESISCDINPAEKHDVGVKFSKKLHLPYLRPVEVPIPVSEPQPCCTKPVKVKAPLGPEDVPPGSVVGEFTEDGINHGWTQVIFVTRVGIGYAESSGRVGIESFQTLFDDPLSRISRDGGKTWHHCWKESE